jgi:hypothetical protein
MVCLFDRVVHIDQYSGVKTSGTVINNKEDVWTILFDDCSSGDFNIAGVEKLKEQYNQEQDFFIKNVGPMIKAKLDGKSDFDVWSLSDMTRAMSWSANMFLNMKVLSERGVERVKSFQKKQKNHKNPHVLLYVLIDAEDEEKAVVTYEKLIYMRKRYVAKKAQSITLDKIKTYQIASKDDAAAHPKNDEAANPNNEDIARVWLEMPDETKALINQLINSDGGVLTKDKNNHFVLVGTSGSLKTGNVAAPPSAAASDRDTQTAAVSENASKGATYLKTEDDSTPVDKKQKTYSQEEVDALLKATGTIDPSLDERSVEDRLFTPKYGKKEKNWLNIMMIAKKGIYDPDSNKDAEAAWCMQCKLRIPYQPGKTRTIEYHVKNVHNYYDPIQTSPTTAGAPPAAVLPPAAVPPPPLTQQYVQPPAPTQQYVQPPAPTQQYVQPPAPTQQYFQPPAPTQQYFQPPAPTQHYVQPPPATPQNLFLQHYPTGKFCRFCGREERESSTIFCGGCGRLY